jgi:hypothetical protein
MQAELYDENETHYMTDLLAQGSQWVLSTEEDSRERSSAHGNSTNCQLKQKPARETRTFDQ